MIGYGVKRANQGQEFALSTPPPRRIVESGVGDMPTQKNPSLLLVIKWYWRFFRSDIICAILAIATLLAVIGIFNRFNQEIIWRGGKTGEELQHLETENETLRKQIQNRIDADKRMEKNLQNYLRDKGSPFGADYVESVFAIEKEQEFPNLHLLAPAISGAESTFGKSYRNPFNPYGAGHCAGCKGLTFASWDDAHRWLVNYLKEQGFDGISYEDIPQINYADSNRWAGVVMLFWGELKMELSSNGKDTALSTLR